VQQRTVKRGNSDRVTVVCSMTWKWSINPIIQNPVSSHAPQIVAILLFFILLTLLLLLPLPLLRSV
jgi:hypothetical protein